jgi:hypothetical protein
MRFRETFAMCEGLGSMIESWKKEFKAVERWQEAKPDTGSNRFTQCAGHHGPVVVVRLDHVGGVVDNIRTPFITFTQQ